MISWGTYCYASGARVKLILIDAEDDIVGYALHFEFSATNNKAEYKALIVGLQVEGEAGAQHLKVFSDSQLAVGQIKGEYEVWEKNMKKYLQKIKNLTSTFLSFDIQ